MIEILTMSHGLAPRALKSTLTGLLILVLGVYAAPASAYRVQVIGLADKASQVREGRAKDDRSANVTNTQSDSFCVVGEGGAVQLTLTNTTGTAPSGYGWLARSSSGSTLEYIQVLSYADGSQSTVVSKSGAGANQFIVSAQRAAPSATACGTGNMMKSVTAVPSTILSPGTYVDTVNLLASPI